MKVDMSPKAVTERLRLMGELCTQLMEEMKANAEDSSAADAEAEPDPDDDTSQNREQ